MNKEKRYQHITKAERLEIALLKEKQYRIRDIARVLNRSPGTIYDEMKRNAVNGAYDPKKADHKAYTARKYSKYQGMKVVQRPALREYVEDHMMKDWSPEEISGRIAEIDSHLPSISPKGIYKYVASIYGRRLERHLAYKGRTRYPHPRQKVIQLKDRVFIDQRPDIVDDRARFGDWEGDFIVSGRSGRGALLVLHERKARYASMKKIPSPSIKAVHQYLSEITGGIVMNTLTLDNDILFRRHKEMSRILGVPVYFCHPYHSWEKGGVENTNKLIRRYIPKGSDISKVSDEYVYEIQEKLNARPRKCLGYRTPQEVMEKHHQFIPLPAVQDFDSIKNIITNKKAECSA